MISFPAALITGIVGICYDRRKWLAILVTCNCGCVVGLYLLMFSVLVFCV